MAKATLLVTQGVDQGARFEIGDREVSLGRGGRNDIRILDTEISRQHATIHFEDGVFILTDRNSANGTYVNGAPIRSRRLKSGDQIQCGCSALLFSVATDDQQSAFGAAHNVHISTQPDTEDRSSIVGEVGHDAQQELLEQTLAIKVPEVAQMVANLQALYRISEEAVSPSISIEQFLRSILDITIQVVDADRGCMLISDSETQELVPQVFSVRRGVEDSSRMPISRTIVDYVRQRGQGVRTSDAQTDRRFEAGGSILRAGIREAMCVPMQGRYEQVGVIYLDTTTPSGRAVVEGTETETFSEDTLRLLVAIGRQAALAIEDNRFQQALVKAERFSAMGQTIATLSHHIKNILQGVRGGSYLIDLGLKDHDEGLVAKGWNIVEKNQNKIYHLVMDMLTFSTEREPAWEEASLNETVSDVFELMEPRAAECQVRIECQLDRDLPHAVFDAEGIHRAVLNIVINAIDAVEGEEGGRVVVSAGHNVETDEFFVAVADNGPGILESQLSRIFNVFESTKGSRGTGLGLAVSRKIIREHGGDIIVESTPGHGCRFVLAWPRLVTDEGLAGSKTIV